MADVGQIFGNFAPFAAVMGVGGLAAWFYLERMKIKNGYPTENIWGKPMYPKAADDKILSMESDIARQVAQIARLEERTAVLERIITDKGVATAAQIEKLRNMPLN